MPDWVDVGVDQTSLRETLGAAYVAGALEPALQLLVETQCELRAHAAHEIAAAEALAGALLESETPAALSATALERTLARIAADPSQAPPAAPQCAMRAAASKASAVLEEVLKLPVSVRDNALMALGRGGWTFAGPGIRTLPLEIEGAAKVEIIRIEPGWGSPRHHHTGGEYTLVMAGAFSDERGRYDVGDIAYGGPGIVHRPVAAQGEICYCLAVSESNPVFTGPLGLLQRLWRH